MGTRTIPLGYETKLDRNRLYIPALRILLNCEYVAIEPGDGVLKGYPVSGPERGVELKRDRLSIPGEKREKSGIKSGSEVKIIIDPTEKCFYIYGPEKAQELEELRPEYNKIRNGLFCGAKY